MKDFWQERREREEKAERLEPKVEYRAREHWAKSISNYEGYKSYDVVFKGEVIGQVNQERENLYRKAGRLISRSWHRKAWQFKVPHKDGWTLPTGLYYRSRKRAVVEMLEHLIQRGDLK